MIEHEQLLENKNALILALEAAKAAKRPGDRIPSLASRAAALEGQIARKLLLENRRDAAIVNLISEASCLVDARRRSEARRVFDHAYALATAESLRAWIQSQIGQLNIERVPASIFMTGRPFIQGNEKLRKPQVLGYLAAQEHFSRSRDHAILQLPVGCGKTGLMAIVPFALSGGRVLVVAPNLEITRNLARQLDYSNTDSFFHKTNVLQNGGSGPSCAVLDASAAIFDCDASDYVVTNVQQLVAGNAKKWLAQFPPDYFDMVLIDEGHHNVAPSWQDTLARFPDAKIASFTATPLRSDGKRVEGTPIFRFPIVEAIRGGYIRDIASRALEPAEVYFEYRGSKERHSFAEVLRLRDQEWFSRGVALSSECNRHIVDASIQAMRELREAGDANHQIIAAACSIDHARAIRSLYAERNCLAEVIHSQLSTDAQEHIRRQLTAGEIDAIVHVQMLGEGADYPNLGVAAIFRPYRHLVPYVQFVGRIMRVLREGMPGHPDNRGFVISHVGLNIDRWWQELRELDRDDQLFFEAMAHNALDFQLTSSHPPVEEPQLRRRFVPTMRVLEETVEHFVQEHFLPEDTRAVVDDLVNVLNLRGLDLDTLGVSREQLQEKLADVARVERQRRGRVVSSSVQPQRQRQEARKRLNERVRSAAKELLNEVQLRIVGFELPRLFAVGAVNNLATAIILLNTEVSAYLGVGLEERDLMTTEQLHRAHDEIDIIVDRVAAKIRARQGKNSR